MFFRKKAPKPVHSTTPEINLAALIPGIFDDIVPSSNNTDEIFNNLNTFVENHRPSAPIDETAIENLLKDPNGKFLVICTIVVTIIQLKILMFK